MDDQESICCKRFLHVPGQSKPIIQYCSVNEAVINRDTFSRIVYEKMFNRLIQMVNNSIIKPFKKSKSNYKSIGLLDIFGFEIFKDNSFEQLCINYTNEKLQQHFNHHMFKIEQKEYEEEKIAWKHIEFVDNQVRHHFFNLSV